jgi:16S rRNA (guanine527-N7)-methyltransferase
METEKRLALYKELLLTWTQKVNLIGPEAKRNIDEHIAEALEAASVLRPSGEVLDFGSGGGLPALPMAIVSPEARFHLVEADQKKWAFLKFAARECQLNCVVHGDRLQRLIQRLDSQQKFSLVTSRAVGYPEEWLPLIAERLTADGRVALFQGEDRTDVPGFAQVMSHRFTRGASNFLVVLTAEFHVEQHG